MVGKETNSSVAAKNIADSSLNFRKHIYPKNVG